MQRSCDACGRSYEAKRATSKYCGSNCRTRVSRAGGAPQPKVVVALDRPTGLLGDLVDVTRRRLEAVDRLDTVLGLQAVFLADQLVNGGRAESGSSLASLSKELRAVMDAALEGVAKAADPVDELRRRREAKLTG